MKKTIWAIPIGDYLKPSDYDYLIIDSATPAQRTWFERNSYSWSTSWSDQYDSTCLFVTIHPRNDRERTLADLVFN